MHQVHAPSPRTLSTAAPPAPASEREIPTIPYGPALITPLTEFFGNPLGVLQWVERGYGTLARFRGPDLREYFVVSDPEIVSEVLRRTDGGRVDQFDKSSFLANGGSWIIGDDTVLVTSNQQWRTQRQKLAPDFTRTLCEKPEVIAAVRRAVERCGDELESRIRSAGAEGADIDLQDEMSILALRVAMSAMFGKPDVPRSELEHLRNASRHIHAAFPLETITPFDIPFKMLGSVSHSAAEIAESKAYLLNFADGLIESADAGAPRTFVSAMVDAAHGGCPGFNPGVIRHTVLALLFAGHESSGNNLAWTLCAACSDPSIHQRLLAEAASGAGDEGLSALTAALPWTRRTLDEGLRMYPPVYLLLRRAAGDVEIPTADGIVHFPKNAEILLNVFGSQRNEAHWGSARTGFPANCFSIDRWSEENLKSRGLGSNDMNLNSFGGGARICLGMHLFLLEALETIRGYLRRFSIEPRFKQLETGLRSDFTLQRKGGFPVRARIRSGTEDG